MAVEELVHPAGWRYLHRWAQRILPHSRALRAWRNPSSVKMSTYCGKVFESLQEILPCAVPPVASRIHMHVKIRLTALLLRMSPASTSRVRKVLRCRFQYPIGTFNKAVGSGRLHLFHQLAHPDRNSVSRIFISVPKTMLHRAGLLRTWQVRRDAFHRQEVVSVDLRATRAEP